MGKPVEVQVFLAAPIITKKHTNCRVFYYLCLIGLLDSPIENELEIINSGSTCFDYSLNLNNSLEISQEICNKSNILKI